MLRVVSSIHLGDERPHIGDVRGAQGVAKYQHASRAALCITVSGTPAQVQD